MSPSYIVVHEMRPNKPWMGRSRAQRRRIRARQQGFSLVEVSIVTAIVLLLAIISIPAIGSYVVENKVPKVGEELARFILQTKVNASGGSAAPYLTVSTAHLANMVRDSSIFSVADAGGATRVLHGLGSNGDVTVAPAESGAAFTVTLAAVNDAACPSIASVLQRVSDSITVAADGQAAVTVKNSSTVYSALDTESRCKPGDVNTFAFLVR